MTLRLSVFLAITLIFLQGTAMATSLNEKYKGRVRAVELPQDKNWLNVKKPLKLEDLKGKVVILDFWTYCCINCIHVLPTLKKIEERFQKEVVVIGVHSAKFENEKLTANIEAAIKRYKIQHPVINDDTMSLWRQYGVNSWPTLVIIDPQGYVVGGIPGEPSYERLENLVLTLIEDHEEAGTLKRGALTGIVPLAQPDTPLSYPGKLAYSEKHKMLFVSDSNHNRIVGFTLEGEVKIVIGSGESGWQDGSFSGARFKQPQGIAAYGDHLFIADTENHLIRKIDLKNKTVSTLAGRGFQGSERRPQGNPLKVALNSPWDLLVHEEWLYIAMAGPHQIWAIDLKKNQIHLYAGSGREDILDGPLALANFAQPSGLATNGDYLFVADSEVSGIRAVNLDVDQGQVETIVGEGLFEFGDKDGFGPEVRLQHALGVDHHEGLLYVADTYNHKIKTIDPKVKKSRTFIGTGKAGDIDGSFEKAQIFEPSDVLVVGEKLFITDTNNQKIKVADLKSKQIKTLELKGLKSPEKNQEEPTALSLHLKPGKSTLTVKVNLAAGLKMNAMAPHELVIDSKAMSEQKSFPLEFKKDKAEISIESLAGIVDKDAKITATLYPCTDDEKQLCFFKRLVFNASIQVDESGSKTPQIAISIEKP